MSLRRLFDRLEKFLRRIFNREKEKSIASPGPTQNLEVINVAKNVVISWVLPTTRRDGELLPPDQIKHTLIQIRVGGSALPWSTVGTVPPGGPQQLTLADQAGGAWEVRAIVVDTGNRPTPEDEAEVVTFDVEVSSPGPTTGLEAVVQP